MQSLLLADKGFSRHNLPLLISFEPLGAKNLCVSRMGELI